MLGDQHSHSISSLGHYWRIGRPISSELEMNLIFHIENKYNVRLKLITLFYLIFEDTIRGERK